MLCAFRVRRTKVSDLLLRVLALQALVAVVNTQAPADHRLLFATAPEGPSLGSALHTKGFHCENCVPCECFPCHLCNLCWPPPTWNLGTGSFDEWLTAKQVKKEECRKMLASDDYQCKHPITTGHCKHAECGDDQTCNGEQESSERKCFSPQARVASVFVNSGPKKDYNCDCSRGVIVIQKTDDFGIDWSELVSREQYEEAAYLNRRGEKFALC